MRKIRRDEVLPLGAYEEIRDRFRSRVIALKTHRRVAVGGEVALVFENRDTMLLQTQEMLRTERITSEAAIRSELETWNELVPGPGELVATLLVEITDREKIREKLDRLVGLDRHVALVLGALRIRASFEPGHMTEKRVAAVQYVRFALPPEAARTLRDPAADARIAIDHPAYAAQTPLSPEARESLAADLDET